MIIDLKKKIECYITVMSDTNGNHGPDVVESRTMELLADDRYPQGIDIKDSKNFKFNLNELNLVYLSNFDHLNCPICKNPLINPYLTICGHCFCKECLFESFNSLGFKCPLDRTTLNVSSVDNDSNSSIASNSDEFSGNDNNPKSPQMQDDVFPAPIIISNILDDLKVKCLNSKRGCNWIGSRWEIKLHLLNDCDHTRFNCEVCEKLVEKRFVINLNENESVEDKTNSGKDENTVETKTETESETDKLTKTCPHSMFECEKCTTLVNLITKDSHLEKECEENLVQCKGCKLSFPKKSISTHENYCSKIYVPCPSQKFGCDWKGSKELLEEIHLQNCIFTKLSGYLSTQEEKIDSLNIENKNLKKQIDILLDSAISGRLTNLGFPLQLEEVSSNDNTNYQLGINSNFNDFGFNLITNNEDTFLNLLIELSNFKKTTENSISSLNTTVNSIALGLENLKSQVDSSPINPQINDLNYLKLSVNSLRQQFQFLLSNDRRRRHDTFNNIPLSSPSSPSSLAYPENSVDGIGSSSTAETTGVDHSKLSNKL